MLSLVKTVHVYKVPNDFLMVLNFWLWSLNVCSLFICLFLFIFVDVLHFILLVSIIVHLFLHALLCPGVSNWGSVHGIKERVWLWPSQFEHAGHSADNIAQAWHSGRSISGWHPLGHRVSQNYLILRYTVWDIRGIPYTCSRIFFQRSIFAN